MKARNVVLAILMFGIVGSAFAHDREYRRDHRGYNRHHHHRPIIIMPAPVIIPGGETAWEVLPSPFLPPATVFCGYVVEHVTDRRGRPLYNRYGEPRVRTLPVCSRPE